MNIFLLDVNLSETKFISPIFFEDSRKIISETIDRSTWTIPTRLSRIGADGDVLRIIFRRGVAHYRAFSFSFSSSLARRSLRPWPVF